MMCYYLNVHFQGQRVKQWHAVQLLGRPNRSLLNCQLHKYFLLQLRGSHILSSIVLDKRL